MRTRTLVLDRVITLIVGLVLVAAGVAAWLWFYAVLLTDPRIDVDPVREILAADWWPWAVGAAGVVLAVLGLRRLVAHIPHRGVSSLRLESSSDEGSLAVDAGAITAAATQEIKDIEGVRTARGRLLQERGQLVTDLVVVTVPGASLAHVSAACDQVAATVAAMAQRDDLTFRVDLRVALRGRALPRTR